MERAHHGGSRFSAMLGTCIAVMDGYARSLSQSLAVALGGSFGPLGSGGPDRGGRWPAIVVMFSGQIKQLVDLATTLVPGGAAGRVLEPPTCDAVRLPRGCPSRPWPSGVGLGRLGFSDGVHPLVPLDPIRRLTSPIKYSISVPI